MKIELTVIVAFVFSLLTAIATIINLFLTIKRDNKNNVKEDIQNIKDDIEKNKEMNTGIIKANMKLDQVCNTTNGISLQVDRINDKVNAMALKQENHETRIRILEGNHEIKKNME